MNAVRHDIQHCRWSEQTLMLGDPYWLNAWDFPWSCRRDGEPRPVDDTRVCRVCQRWESREEMPLRPRREP